MTEFLYRDPNFEPDKDGNRVIINKRCVGPIEVIIYGITKKNEYYLDWTFPGCYPDDAELERDYKIISRDEMLGALDIEIETCKKDGNIEMANKYIQAKKQLKIINRENLKICTCGNMLRRFCDEVYNMAGVFIIAYTHFADVGLYPLLKMKDIIKTLKGKKMLIMGGK